MTKAVSLTRITTNIFSSLTYLLLLLIVVGCSPRETRTTEKPNILFILADDMGWQDTSVPFGPMQTKFNQRYQTPTLQRLAAEGVKFTQAYSCAVCSPSRVSLMTGLNEARHKVTQWTYLSGDRPSSDLPHPTLSPSDWNWNGLQPEAGLPNAISTEVLPEIFKKAGYRTMHFGKGHLGAAGTPGADPKAFGFDIRIGGRDAGGCGSYWGTKNFGALANPDGPWRAWDLDHYFGEEIHLTQALTQEAIREIRAAVEANEPFFCYFAHYAPHTPIEPDERFAPAYRNKGLDETEAAYASLIEGLDQSTGELLALLDELGVAENTLVVFTSDNGGLSHDRRSMDPPHTHNSPLSSGKGSHHEGGIRVPLLVRWPAVAPGGITSHTPVILYDWFPTLLEVASLTTANPTDGLSLVSLLQGQSTEEFDRPLVWHFPNFWGPLQRPEPVKGPGMGPSSTIRYGDWKLIYYHTDQRFELFDLERDLGEKKNLATERPDVVNELSEKLTGYLQERDAVMPTMTSTEEKVPMPSQARP